MAPFLLGWFSWFSFIGGGFIEIDVIETDFIEVDFGIALASFRYRHCGIYSYAE